MSTLFVNKLKAAVGSVISSIHKIKFNNGIQTDLIQDTTGNDALTIDSSGRVKRSNIPYIQLLKNNHESVSAGATLTDWRVRQSNELTISSGIITVPITGLYHVGISLITEGSSGVYIAVNGVNQFRPGYGAAGSSESWSAVSGDFILYLNANDNIRIVSENAVSYYGTTTSSTVSSFYCYLIG